MNKTASGPRLTKEVKERNDVLADELFAYGEVVYNGYVDDPRNTDHAWIETTAYHFHCSDDCAKNLRLDAGDETSSVRWIDIDQADDNYAGLYASHKDWVDKVSVKMLPHKLARDAAESMRLYDYPSRAPVDDSHVSWQVSYPEYDPPRFSSTDQSRRHLPRSPSRSKLSPAAKATSWADFEAGSCEGEAGSAGRLARSRSSTSITPPPTQVSRSSSEKGGIFCGLRGAVTSGPGESDLSPSSAASARWGSRNRLWLARPASAAQLQLGSGPQSPSSPGSVRSQSIGDHKSMSERLGSFSRSRSPSNGRISLGSMAEDKIMLEGGLRRLSSDEIVPPPPSAPDAEEPLAVHGLMERRSYEAPIAFAGERDFTPLNPRGRTGLSGRGCLNHWGPNHVCEPLITRFHPRGESMLGPPIS